MTWTYSGDPSSSIRDQIRFLIGDTVSGDPQVTDEEIAWAYATAGGVRTAAILLVESLIARCARLVSQSTGGISVSYGDRLAHYQALLGLLKASGSMVPSVYSGGISQSDVEANRADFDWRQGPFKEEQFDNPDAAGDEDPT